MNNEQDLNQAIAFITEAQRRLFKHIHPGTYQSADDTVNSLLELLDGREINQFLKQHG
jgi:hypothetical protein